MVSIKKNLLYGFITWIIPFMISFAFISPDGEFIIDKIFFKTIMLVIGGMTGAFLLIKYFKFVEEKYLKESIIIGVTWLLINWILDLVILVPMSKIGIGTYFIEIGLRYLIIPIMK